MAIVGQGIIGPPNSSIAGRGGGVAAGLAIPEDGLLSMLDGSVTTSFWSDLAKTTNSTEGGSVAVWEDQSGNGNDWTQSNASYRPLAHLSALRLYNDGTQGTSTSKHLVGPNISSWTEGSFFARVQNINNAQGAIWGTTSWSSSNSLNHWNLSNVHYLCFGVNTRAADYNWGTIPGGGVSSTDLMTYEENTSSDGTNRVYINNVLRAAGDLGTVGFRTAPYLGCGVRSNSPQYSGGFYFYKFCAYNRVVTSEERTTINAWLES